MYQVRDLTEKEIRALEIARQVTSKVRVRGRCDMILLAHQGFSPAEIAQRVPCVPSTVIESFVYWRAATRQSVSRPQCRPSFDASTPTRWNTSVSSMV